MEKRGLFIFDEENNFGISCRVLDNLETAKRELKDLYASLESQNGTTGIYNGVTFTIRKENGMLYIAQLMTLDKTGFACCGFSKADDIFWLETWAKNKNSALDTIEDLSESGFIKSSMEFWNNEPYAQNNMVKGYEPDDVFAAYFIVENLQQ